MQKENNKWLLTNRKDFADNYKYIRKIGKELTLFSDLEIEELGEGKWFIIDGYVIPRFNVFKELGKYNQRDLLKLLLEKNNTKFIDLIKGAFTIIYFDGIKVHIINDWHSFKKFFYFFNTKEDFIISNLIKPIINHFGLKPNNELIALYCLFEHNVNGYTIYKNLFYSKPAMHLSLDINNNYSINYYFSPLSLLRGERNEMDVEEIGEFWSHNISNYIKYFQPDDYALTLTGGNDSRLILAGLLKKGHYPSLFSFGNSMSFDGIIAKKISNRTGLSYNNYFIKRPNAQWMSEYSQKIIGFGNGMINIHRAHRLDAIEKVKDKNRNVQMIFAGFMGGDYLKGLSYDDYITPRILRLFNESDRKKQTIKEIIKSELKKNYIQNVDKEKLFELIWSLPCVKIHNKKEREFITLYMLIGSVHDMQDTYVFATEIKYVINPYMDIDFLNLIFKSQYTYLSVKNHFLFEKLRLNRSDFHIKLTDYLAPQLSDIEYAKKGYYTANEYINDSSIILLFKRFLRLSENKQFPQNFPLDYWFKEFVQYEINHLENDVVPIFNVRELVNLLNNTIQTTEGYWHKFTNPINVSKNLVYNKKSE